ncbi:MAG: hypothetical protein ABIU29_00855 [Chthoniobacterales bacterium]
MSGIVIENATNCLIGGTTPAARNLISGNSGAGVLILGLGSGDAIQGNYIGTDAIGTMALGNDINGVRVNRGASAPLIGGTVSGAGNLISGNLLNGIAIGDGFLTGTPEAAVQGNFIDTTATSTAPLENEDNGILINRTDNNLIGGTEPMARNIISANTTGVLISAGATGNVVQGNYIGTDVTGFVDIWIDDLEGVKVEDSPANLIGGSVPGAGNLISGNVDNVEITGAAAIGNLIQGNLIGTDATSTARLDFFSAEILLINNSTGTIVGGPAGFGNIIAFNGGAGGVVIASSSTGNNIFGNSIFANEEIGINLVGGRRRCRHRRDSERRPRQRRRTNNLQNYPVIDQITVAGSDRSVAGSLTSNPAPITYLTFTATPKWIFRVLARAIASARAEGWAEDLADIDAGGFRSDLNR